MKAFTMLVLGVLTVGCGSSVPNGANGSVNGSAGVNAAGEARTAQASPAADATITFHINSWGKPITAWRIGPDGEGIYVTYPDKNDNSTLTQEAVVKRFSVGADGYRRVRALLRDAEAFRRPVANRTRPYEGGEPPCDEQISDRPYGKIEWSGETPERVRIDYGCKSAAAATFHRSVEEAEQLVRSWANNARAERVAAPAGHGAANDPFAARR